MSCIIVWKDTSGVMACCSRSSTAVTVIRTEFFPVSVTAEEVRPWEDPAPFEIDASRLVCIVAAEEGYVVKGRANVGNAGKGIERR
jgi:hypothetical protein